MNAITGITLFLCLMLLSLLAVSYVNRVQKRDRMIRENVRQIKLAIEGLEESSLVVEPLLESVSIPKLINEEILRLLEAIHELDPHAPFTAVKRESASKTLEQLTTGKRNHPLYRALPSDAAIARAKYHLTATARLIRKLYRKEQLDDTEFETLTAELSWAHMMVEVVSHLNEGHNAIKKDESAIAYGHYLRAQNALIGHHLHDKRRRQLIDEINALAKGQTKKISAELIPELATVDFSSRSANTKSGPESGHSGAMP